MSTSHDLPASAAMTATEPLAATVAARVILHTLLDAYSGPVAAALWTGETVIGDEASPCRVIFRRSAPLRDLVLHQDVIRLAEAYLGGYVDVEGDMELLLGISDYLQELELSLSLRFRLMREALRIPVATIEKEASAVRAAEKRQRNCQSSIAHHYDVSNEFYRLWLDPEMVYSCAYFDDPDQDLCSAQQNKLDYICRKLRLVPGQSMLDIGCGWGALACWAARNYDVHVYGITLSEQQYDFAVERVKKEGLQESVTIELRDYRDLPGDIGYDRIVSVGMFEHIGVKNFPGYFGTVKQLLKPGGLFLNHGITNDTGWRNTPVTRFMNCYVFPDAELARISQVITAMEDAGFEIIDVEGLRRHYVLTLRRWVQTLKNRRAQAVAIVGEPSFRVWELYMAGSAYYFELGSSGLFQVLAGHAQQPLSIPLRREDIYQAKEVNDV
ncbi:class I SAM-dependent methyltransferase [Mariprofundus ferrooxydans]|uniref:Cyclopropane-fatty-acyl-phospholipid synthase n=1 Tax=Mariprofundus ferrooxydans PV-1 TaxID=314345 RepID=Q0F1K4_9PROT|nr:class I SAM-dependent methyltransferase [Mariprofundus ferrooxydans]EAU55187.1 Cyclopropane-fatty-acyl-phospholipid synthase [Mariprofundus ferrooxydans PV-1]